MFDLGHNSSGDRMYVPFHKSTNPKIPQPSRSSLPRERSITSGGWGYFFLERRLQMDTETLKKIERAMDYAEHKRRDAVRERHETRYHYWVGQVEGIRKVLAIIGQHG